MRTIAAERRAVAIGERTVVLDQAFQRLPGEVQPVEGRDNGAPARSRRAGVCAL